MNIALLRQPIQSVRAQWLVLGNFEDETEPPVARGNRLWTDRHAAGRREGPDGLAGRAHGPLRDPGSRRAGSFGRSGFAAAIRAGAAYSAGFALSKRLAGKRREGVAVVLPPSDLPEVFASALIEGAIVATRGPGYGRPRRIGTRSRR